MSEKNGVSDGRWAQGIGRVVVISLREEGAQRRAALGPRLRRWGLLGRTVTHATDRLVATAEPSLRVRMGELGCAVGHREAIELAAADGAPTCLVMEDDVEAFEGADLEGVRVLLECLEERADWDVVNLGGCAADWRAGTPAFGSAAMVPGLARRVFGMVSTHAVVYHARAYGAVLSAVPPRETARRQYASLVKPRAYDEWLHGALRVVAPMRPVFFQSGAESAILAGGRHVIDVKGAIERTGQRLEEMEAADPLVGQPPAAVTRLPVRTYASTEQALVWREAQPSTLGWGSRMRACIRLPERGVAVPLVEKAASTSVFWALLERWMPERWAAAQEAIEAADRAGDHLGVRMVRDIVQEEVCVRRPEELEGLQMVALVRDPWARFVSGWRHQSWENAYGRTEVLRRRVPRCRSLEEMAWWLAEQDPGTVDEHFAPQWTTLLPGAVVHPLTPAGVRDFCAATGLEDLPRQNRAAERPGETPDLAEYVEVEAFVREMYRTDGDLYQQALAAAAATTTA